MKRSIFDSMSEKEIIVFLINNSICALKDAMVDKQDKKLKINGDSFLSENDIMDAYGYGSISRKQMEKALEMLRSSGDNERKFRKAIDFLQNAYELVRDGFDEKLERKK